MPPHTETSTTPAEDVPKARIFNAMDHYNTAAASLKEIQDHYQDDDFTANDASLLLKVAEVHAGLGLLKLGIDNARWEGRMP